MSFTSAVSSLHDRWSRSLFEQSLSVRHFLKQRMVWIAAGWIALAGAGAALRMTYPAAPVDQPWTAWPMLAAYSAMIAAPISGYLLASSAYAGERARKPLDFHLSFIGRWRSVSTDEAQSHPMFGPVGFLASLLIGLLLNVLMRSGEFLLAVPAMSANAPGWALTLFLTMAIDVIVMNFFYMVAFVMALRSIPLFPRMLAFVWLTDIVMQIMIAEQVSSIPALPNGIIEPLLALLQGNLTKAFISIAVWAPYLLLSQRVNLTYRSRLQA